MRSKTLLPVLGLLLCAPGAWAQDSFFTSCHEPLQPGSTLDLGTVRSEGEGVVRVYDYRLGEKADLLGETAVHEGINDVRVFTQTENRDRVLAELSVGDTVVASMVYGMCRTDN